MAWLAVDSDEREFIHALLPERRYLQGFGYWQELELYYSILLPKGSIKKLIWREMTWEDEPFELK